jgi:hypothetical protein
MFKPFKGKCICHNQERWIVVKAGYCKQGNDEQKNKRRENASGAEKVPGGPSLFRRKVLLPEKYGRLSNSGEGKPSNERFYETGSTIRKGYGKNPKNKKRKPIPRISDKRKKQEVAYQALRKVYLATHPQCEANIQGVCSGEPAHEIHHTYSGKDREKYYLDTTTWKAVERCCHDWIHLHPIEAREMGLLK